MKEFQVMLNREYLMKRMGDISQLAGVKRYELLDGKAKGIEAVDFKTGTGFCFTVLPGRGMDIAWADYRGVPVGYISKTGIASPAYYESEGVNWLRNFFAGLLTTCGLGNVGGPCEEMDPVVGKRNYGLHGRLSNMGADHVCAKEMWQGDRFIMSVAGRLRESMLHSENLTLQREITTELGSNCLIISDSLENEGFTEQPFMLLYHINIGYPVLDKGSRFICNSVDIQPNDELASQNISNFHIMNSPMKHARENVYFHDLKRDGADLTYVGLVNDRLEVGAYVKFNKKQLPKLTQWKQLAEAEYVLGIEPANCLPVGRTEQRKRGDLERLQPGEKRQFDLEIGVLTDAAQIESFARMVQSLK